MLHDALVGEKLLGAALTWQACDPGVAGPHHLEANRCNPSDHPIAKKDDGLQILARF